MNNLKCPFCGKKLWYDEQDGIYRCMKKYACVMHYEGATEQLWQELIRTRKALEQSEICCAKWEKQALDSKAENIALSDDLECTRKALDKALHYLDAEYYAYIMVHKKEPELIAKVLDEIKTALEQKDVK